MVPGIDPKVDYAFKWLFGVERNRHLLIDLIDAVLDPPPQHRIVEIELLNPFSDKEALDDRLTILDIKARDQSGRRFNVEMQMLPHDGFSERILYYWARLHSEQLREGEPYHVLRPTISICFLNGVLFRHVANYRLQFELRNREYDVVFSPQIAIHLLELQKFDRPVQQVSTSLDRWLYFLRNAQTLDTDAVSAELDDPAIRNALEELQVFSQTELERDRYERRQLAIRDDMARQEDAMNRGIEKGRGQGELVKQVLIFESLMNRPATPKAELYDLPLEELEKRADELEREFRQSGNGNANGNSN